MGLWSRAAYFMAERKKWGGGREGAKMSTDKIPFNVTPSDVLPLTRTHLLKILPPPKIALPAEDQVFNT
jgi:hypothetical protein